MDIPPLEGLIIRECDRNPRFENTIIQYSFLGKRISWTWNYVLQRLNMFKPDPAAAAQDLDPLIKP